MMFISAITTKSGYILALCAVYADGSKWVRWYTPSVINAKDYPHVITYKTRDEARIHARSVLRRGKHSGVFPLDAKYVTIPVWTVEQKAA